MNYKILLWNAREWRNKKEELYEEMQDYDINVITKKVRERTILGLLHNK